MNQTKRTFLEVIYAVGPVSKRGLRNVLPEPHLKFLVDSTLGYLSYQGLIGKVRNGDWSVTDKGLKALTVSTNP